MLQTLEQRDPAERKVSKAVAPQKRGRTVEALIRVVIAATFTAVLSYVYIVLLSPLNSYMGFRFVSPNLGITILAIILAIIPSIYLPSRLELVSCFSIWMIYFVVYIPSIIIPMLQGYISDIRIVYLLVSLLIGFMAMVSITRLGSRVLVFPKITPPMFWIVTLGVYAIIHIYLVFVFWGFIHFSSLAGLYAQRFLTSDIQAGTFSGYAIGMLYGALNPFLIVHGLYRKRFWSVLLGSLGQIFVYSIIAYKSVLLSIPLMITIYYVVLRIERPRKLVAVGLFMLFAITIPLVVHVMHWLPGYHFYDEQLQNLLYLRTFGMTGTLTGVYADFFTQNPITWFSHINIVRLVYPYPYQLPLGVEVGIFLTGGRDDIDANFFATDGIAALGLFGPIVAGLIMAIILRFIDCLIDKRHLGAFSVASTMALMGLADTSIFTTILTGGLGTLVVVFGFWQSSQGSELVRRKRGWSL